MAPVAETGRDFSLIGMISHADPVVQAIAILLVICSIASWAIAIEKWLRISKLTAQTEALEAEAAKGCPASAKSSETPKTASDGIDLATALTTAAHIELADAVGSGETRADIRARLERAMRAAMRSHLRGIERGLPFLATVGSTTPFVGLFGTVWGIMHSFVSIAQSRDTSLAVVAPGIAEALFVTALGLAAAIPAVVAYNLLTVRLGQAAERIGKTIVVLARTGARTETETKARPEIDKVFPIKGGK